MSEECCYIPLYDGHSISDVLDVPVVDSQKLTNWCEIQKITGSWNAGSQSDLCYDTSLSE